jgi:hypothetical protein
MTFLQNSMKWSSSSASTQLDGSQGFSLRDLLRPGVYKPLLISVCLMIFQQLSGVNAVIFYTEDIFVKAGFNANPSIPTLIVGAALVVFTIASCVLADIAGRRVLLMLSGTLMSLSISCSRCQVLSLTKSKTSRQLDGLRSYV